VKAAYKNSYMHANVDMDVFDSRVCAATVLRFVMPLTFVFVLFIESVQFRFHTGMFILFFTLPSPPSGVMSVPVCLFAHLRMSETKRPNFTKFSLHVIKGRGLVLL